MRRIAFSPLLLGIAIALLVTSLSFIAWRSAPEEMRWLGAGIVNPTDIAVYLSYLRQGGDGHILLSDLFAIEPHTQRFDLVWSTLGMFARLGAPPILVHEATRFITVILLTLAIYAAARDVFKNHRDSLLVTILSLGGISTGWLYSLWLGARQAWTPLTNAAPDIASEFSLGLIMLGGVHGILSVTLLITAVRFIWKTLRDYQFRHLIFACLSGSALLAFHPYFAPVLFLVILLGKGVIHHARPRLWTPGRNTLRPYIALGVSFLLPISYYTWLLRDPVFGQHHLVDNILELGHPLIWGVTLLPFIGAGIWMWRRNKNLSTTTVDWRHIWIAASFLCIILLPVPWKRKLIEGLTIPLVFLTMPAWITVRDYLHHSPGKVLKTITGGLLLIAAWLGPIHLFSSYLQWIQKPDRTFVFYQPLSLFRLADTTRSQTPPDSILLSDDPWVNIWLPALTGRRVWIGHNHETPNFSLKRDQYERLLNSSNSREVEGILNEAGIDFFLTTSPASQQRFKDALSSWKPWIQDGDMMIWKKLCPSTCSGHNELTEL